MIDGHYPDLPVLTDVNSQPPDRSDCVVLATSTTKRLSMWANSDNSSASAYVSDVPKVKLDNSGAVLDHYWDGQPPADYVLKLREFWRPVPSTYHRVQSGDSAIYQVTKTFGLSTTVTQSVSASLGVDEGGISASISATFSTSITTSSETSTMQQYNVTAPAGMVRVWLLYQLVHEIVAIRPDGTLLPADDHNHGIRKAEIVLNPVWPGSSGAWVTYDNPNTVKGLGQSATQLLFPSDLFSEYSKDFAMNVLATA